jgi:hypothetical protein
MDFITENWIVILGALLALSEVLALIPGIKANSVFQLIVNVLLSLKPKTEQEKLISKK